MKSIKRLLLLVVVAAGMSSCASLSSQAGMGAIYMDVQTGEHVTSNPLGSKVGTASVNNILGVYLSGDASIQVCRNQENQPRGQPEKEYFGNFQYL